MDTSGPVGTEVLVEDLFFNVPARRKFLKKEATEASHVHEWVQRIALCYPKVGVKFVRDGKTLADYPPADDLKNRISTVFGRRMAGDGFAATGISSRNAGGLGDSSSFGAHRI